MPTSSTHRLNKRAFLRTTLALAAAYGVSTTPLHAAEPNMNKTKLINSLRSGGHVIYIRHTSTESDYADQIDADPANCSTQRTLSEKGWRQAQLIGAAFGTLELPVGVVLSSEYCRAWQTAEIAFGHSNKRAELNFEPSEEYSAEQVSKMRARVSPLLSAIPVTGTNTVIVGHDDPFEAATEIYPEPQGVAYVLLPDGDGKFTVLGHIKPGEWPSLLTAMR